jgi:hypothetical protein
MTNGNLQEPNTPGQNNPIKWIALGCGGCLGLIVLFSVVAGIFISRTMRFALDPEDVETQGQDLFTYTLPGGSKGILSMDLFGLQITQVASLETPPAAVLTVGKVPAYLESGADAETFTETLQEQVTLEGTYQLLEQRTEERTLCAQTVNLLVQEGRFQDDQISSEAASYFALVEYDNQTRFAWILAQGETPLQTADQVFDSLACQ